MNAPESPPAQTSAGEDSRSGSNMPTQKLDAFTRITASSIVIVYALGFVILAFSDARFGVVQFSPFRARILLVGAVFCVLVFLGAAAQHYGLAYFGPLEAAMKDSAPERATHRETLLVAGFIYTAFLMAAFLGSFLFFASPQFRHSNWRIGLGVGLVSTGFVLLVLAGRAYLDNPRRALFYAVGGGIVAVVGLAFMQNDAEFSLTIFFWTVGVHTSVVKKQKDIWRYLLDFRSWGYALFLLWLYISSIFPVAPPRWGGGQPIPIAVFQNQTAPWAPSNPLDALLLDETDQGLYVLLSPNGKAFFVPRSNVASVFFGRKSELPTLNSVPK